MLAGDRPAPARLITHLENRSAAVPAIMQAIHARGRDAYVVGVTGPPGAGKSTVVDRLTALLRAEDETVGIVAVDPSSPFSGGAVLGDRIRMQAHALDPGVFIRSMATRGSLGGLARATGEVPKLPVAAPLRLTRRRAAAPPAGARACGPSWRRSSSTRSAGASPGPRPPGGGGRCSTQSPPARAARTPPRAPS